MLQNAAGLQNWLRDQFIDNCRYDNLVGDLLSATGVGDRDPGVFYTTLKSKPEKIAASTSRIFLGLQMECAQCHNHPYDDWTQRYFWGYAAFFARLQPPTPGDQNSALRESDAGEVMLPDTEEVVAPRYPGGQLADESQGGGRRMQLTIWMASRHNPFLPRAASNWGWAHMFGRGIVHPVDDMSVSNLPSHPQLLDDLSLYFTRSGFDMKNLLRTLANTKVYQLSSSSEQEVSAPAESFTSMAVKTLTPEQLYACIKRTLAPRPPMSTADGRRLGVLFDLQRQQFVTRMASVSQEVTEYEAGLPQSLMLMNGPTIAQATDVQQSGILGTIEAPLFTNKQRLEMIFLAAVTRRPTANEAERFLAYVEQGGVENDSMKALGDMLWALLNSAEFTLNH